MIAKVLGVYFMVSGVFVIAKRKTLMLILKDIFAHRAISYLIGILLVFGGAALVLRADTGTDGLSIFVRIIAWAILLKGILYILAPEWLHSMTKQFSKASLSFMGAVTALVGAYLVFFM